MISFAVLSIVSLSISASSASSSVTQRSFTSDIALAPFPLLKSPCRSLIAVALTILFAIGISILRAGVEEKLLSTLSYTSFTVSETVLKSGTAIRPVSDIICSQYISYVISPGLSFGMSWSAIFSNCLVRVLRTSRCALPSLII